MQNVRKALVALTLAVAFLGAAVTPGLADDKKADKGNDFVTVAASAGMAEVKLGQLAVERASSDDVKKFGQHMVDDHTKANKELMTIIEKQKITVSKDIDRKHQTAIDELSKLKGAEFDRAYMAQMVKDHEEAVKLFEGQAREGQDAELKAFAAKTLPTIKMHLEMARKLADKDAGKKDR